MTPQQLITAIQEHLKHDESNFVKKLDTIAGIQTLIDENAKLRRERDYYTDQLVDLGYLRYG